MPNISADRDNAEDTPIFTDFKMEKLNCIINTSTVSTSANLNGVVLDFLRQHEHLTGTKEGCREGDCGACTILLGELRGDDVVYRSVNSCLLPLGDANGKHIVTIEGINQVHGLNPIQQAFVDDGGTQCGFCTPGFIMSLTGYCLNHKEISAEEAMNAVDGNICRCTGHPPIKKAIRHFVENAKNNFTVTIIPQYFENIPQRLKELQSAISSNGEVKKEVSFVVSGGTDLYVQKAFSMQFETTQIISSRQQTQTITENETHIIVSAATTVEEFRCSPITAKYFSALKKQLELFGSTPIRNRATIGGNIVNASPIGDMTNILMALNAELHFIDGETKRNLPLRKFYLGYKQLDKKKSELIEQVTFLKPKPNTKFSFEKVSRRTYLDIASVNSSMVFELDGNMLNNVGISAGGVGPTPMYLSQTSQFLNGKNMSEEILHEALNIAQTEISPISDARGSSEYKRLLLRQLLAAHILKFFSEVGTKQMFV